MFMPHTHVTRSSQEQKKEPVPQLPSIQRENLLERLSQNRPQEVIPITLPKYAPVFNYEVEKKKEKEDLKKKKERTYLPGEKMAVNMDKSLRKQKKQAKEDKYINTLSTSIKNVIDIF